METIQQQPVRSGEAPSRRPGTRRIRVVIRRVNPWSALKFSLLFYFCLMLVVVVGLAILYLFLDAMGVIEPFEELLAGLGFGGAAPGSAPGTDPVFEVNTGFLLRTVILIGLISVVLWSAVTLFVAFLYNLISDLVGGVEVTLQERP